MKKLFTVFLITLLLNGTAGSQQQARILYVVNNLGESLSMIDLNTGTVVNDILILGNVPNDLRIQGSTAYVVNSTSVDINIIDLVTNTKMSVITLLPDSNPWELLVEQNRVFVTNSKLNSLSVIDLVTGTMTDEIPVGMWPQGMVLIGDRLYVTNTGFDINSFTYSQGTVSIIDTQSGSVAGTLVVPLNPTALKMGQDGRVYVLCTGDYSGEFGRIAVIDPTAGPGGTPAVVDTFDTGESPGDIAVTDGGNIFIAAVGGWNPGDDGHVFLYDITADSLVHGPSNPLITAAGAMRIIDDPESGAIYVSCFANDQVQALDPVSGAVTATYDVGDGPQAMAIFADVVSAVDEDSPLLPGTFRLEQNYPNPFNPAATISYSIPKDGHVTLTVYSVTGQTAAVPVNEFQTAGSRSVPFDASGLASGMYLYTLKTSQGSITRKMLVVK
ncbi:T9SS type A sorting domain-containing protein [candidate division KSB1 bacterium]